jgi:hypothetical protein
MPRTLCQGVLTFRRPLNRGIFDPFGTSFIGAVVGCSYDPSVLFAREAAS